MAGDWLDALLGNIQSKGVDVELEGTLNFKGALFATRNTDTGAIDVDYDGADLSVPAANVTYDNSDSYLAATTVKAALDELNQNVTATVNITASRALLATDVGKRLVNDSSSSYTITVNKGVLLGDGEWFLLSNTGTGGLAVAAGTTTSVVFKTGKGLALDGQYSEAMVRMHGPPGTPDTLIITGEIVT